MTPRDPIQPHLLFVAAAQEQDRLMQRVAELEAALTSAHRAGEADGLERMREEVLLTIKGFSQGRHYDPYITLCDAIRSLLPPLDAPAQGEGYRLPADVTVFRYDHGGGRVFLDGPKGQDLIMDLFSCDGEDPGARRDAILATLGAALHQPGEGDHD